jgi:hypothetical protein
MVPLIRIVLNLCAFRSSLDCYWLTVLQQGELEHRTPKMRYKRTDRKQFVKQLARMERREARIHRMRPQEPASQCDDEECAATPEAHHTIGKTENFPEHLGLFIQKHLGDPAIEVRASTPLQFLLR